MQASVIVCTYNRAESLGKTLSALCAQEVAPAVGWEIVIVDNNSRDDTPNVVRRVAASCAHRRIRYLFEPRQGLSYARNTGIREAQGDVLLFTDDDVRPAPDWLRKVLDGLVTHDAHACGGYIAPDWEAPPPRWLTNRFHGFLAVRTDRTDTYRITSAAEAPFGANMAVRRRVFDDIGMFDTERGRKADVLSGGEDIELFERILAAGYRVMFFGDASVHHRVEAFRLTKSYLRRWRYQNSRNKAEVLGVESGRTVFGVPPYLLPQTARAIRRAVWASLAMPRDEAFFREMIVWHFLGLMRGLHRRWRRARQERQASF